MKALPIPRRSKTRYIKTYMIRISNHLHCYRCRKRWSLHKLHCMNRKNQYSLNKKRVINSPRSSIMIEDMINLNSSLRPHSNSRKPLLITTFPNGCSASPRIHILEKTRFGRFLISKRKYKLKFFHYERFVQNDMKNHHAQNKENMVGSSNQRDVNEIDNLNKNDVVTLNDGMNFETVKITKKDDYNCAHIVHLIKNEVRKNADFKVVFNDRNTIETRNLSSNVESIRFGKHVLDLTQFESLRGDHVDLGEQNHQTFRLKPIKLKESIRLCQYESPTDGIIWHSHIIRCEINE